MASDKSRSTIDNLPPIAPRGEVEGVHIGVCGFCLPQAELFTRFKLLEVQQTFYKPPQLKTVQRWRSTAPPDFVFTLKAFQAITHPPNNRTYRRSNLTRDEQAACGNFCDTEMVRQAWETTRTLANALESPIVVFQSPPGFDAAEEHVLQLRRFFHWAQRDALRLAWEPRHASWTEGITADLCRELDLIHAVDPLERASVYGVPQYFRLHGTALGSFRYRYNHDYSDDELARIAGQCLERPTYCLFNNLQMATAATRFGELFATARRQSRDG